MIPFAWVGAGAAVVGAATQVYSAAKGGSAQSGAINQGKSEANAALGPYSDTGVLSDTRSADLLGLNGTDAATSAMSGFQASPGYQYQVAEGLRAVDAGAASKGLLHSGATIKAEETLGSNLANQDFGNYMARLNSLSNYGITAAGGQASTDTSAGAALSNIYGAESKGISGAISGLAGNSNVQNKLSGLFSGGGSGGTDSTIYNSDVQGGSYISSSNPSLNF